MLSVRDAVPDDAAAVAGVHVRSWQVGYLGLLPDEYLDALRPEDRMARYTFGSIGPDFPATIVASVDGVISGFATTGPCRDEDVPGAGELFALYVDPASWGRGVGRRLMTEARGHLSRRFSEAVLWVMAGNDRAQRFYEADGWTADGHERTEEVWGVSVNEIRYRRRLA